MAVLELRWRVLLGDLVANIVAIRSLVMISVSLYRYNTKDGGNSCYKGTLFETYKAKVISHSMLT